MTEYPSQYRRIAGAAARLRSTAAVCLRPFLSCILILQTAGCTKRSSPFRTVVHEGSEIDHYKNSIIISQKPNRLDPKLVLSLEQVPYYKRREERLYHRYIWKPTIAEGFFMGLGFLLTGGGIYMLAAPEKCASDSTSAEDIQKAAPITLLVGLGCVVYSLAMNKEKNYANIGTISKFTNLPATAGDRRTFDKHGIPVKITCPGYVEDFRTSADEYGRVSVDVVRELGLYEVEAAASSIPLTVETIGQPRDESRPSSSSEFLPERNDQAPSILLSGDERDFETVTSGSKDLRFYVRCPNALSHAVVRVNGREIYDSRDDELASERIAAQPKLVEIATRLTLTEPRNVVVIEAWDMHNRSTSDTLPLAAAAGERPAFAPDPLIDIEQVPQRSQRRPDDAATLTKLRTLFAGRLRSLIDPGRSEVFVYFAGHGMPHVGTDGQRQYLIPYDGSMGAVPQTCYPLDELYEELASLEARCVLVMLDACFTGIASRSGEGGEKPRYLIEGIRPPQIAPDLPTVAGNMAVFHAATGQMSSSYPQMRHGLFTYYFLKGLGGAADSDRSGGVSVGELHRYLLTNVERTATLRLGRTQTPSLQLPLNKPRELEERVLAPLQ